MSDPRSGEAIHVNEKGEGWRVSRLWEVTADIPPTDKWVFPDGLLDRWSWGEETPYLHLPRVLKADLSYPILVCGGVIVDGNHRLVKSVASGERLWVREMKEMPEPDFHLESELDKRSHSYTLMDMVDLLRSVIENPFLLMSLYGE